ncbi:hypothetical protein KSF73_12020 [Burkholderiaceae bacterium DAT-1]|nr:hypothetical protein [Burkholderiaceae bacterium DAT-1]
MIPRTQTELDAIRDECYAMVTRRASISAGASVIPAFGLDAAADVAILLELIPAINQRFGLAGHQIEGYDPAVKRLIFQVIKRAGIALIGVEITRTLATEALKKIVGKTVTKQVMKFVPVLGWAANAAIGFGAMKYVGNTHVDDCYRVCCRLLAEQPQPV